MFRKAWGGAFCLATGPSPHFSRFKGRASQCLMAGLVPETEVVEEEELVSRLQCFPVFSALAALGNPTGNLLSLDIGIRDHDLAY